jgi:D-alanyl-D-alanine carboxypeptidase
MKKIILILLALVFGMSTADAASQHKSKKHRLHHAKVYKKNKQYTQRTYNTSYALYDYSASRFDNESNKDDVRSIASITKMFTAITVINSKANLNEKLLVKGNNGGKVPRGTQISRIDLLKAMVTNSDNLAAEVLANNHPGGFNQFLIDANAYNKSIGLKDTTIADSSGLLAENKSTASDLVIFLNAIKDNPIIKDIANLRGHEITMPRAKSKRIYTVKFHNTNPDIYKMDDVLISKTGFTNPAGRCVVMLVERGQKVYALIVLGARTTQERSRVLHKLLDHSNLIRI